LGLCTRRSHSILKQFVGVDVSKNSLEVSLSCRGKSRSIANTRGAIGKLIKQLTKSQELLVVCEATGGYEGLLVELLHEAQIPVSVINPGQARAFARSLGRKAKNDPIDAAMLRLYAERIQPRGTEPIAPEIRHLKALTHRRAQIVDMIVAAKNRLSTPGGALLRESITTVIKGLKEQEERLRQQIVELTEASEGLARKYQVLTSMKGIGPIAASSLICLLPELGNANRKEIAALVGLAPDNNDSGKFSRQRRIAGGRALARKIFYMTTLAAVRSNPWLKRFYRRLVEKGKRKMVALTAAARKLIVALNTLVKRDQEWICPISA
jgi:transposase